VSVSLLLVSGSLRRASTNTAVLRTVARHTPSEIRCRLYDSLESLPHFNPDDDRPPLHPAVEALRGEIHRSDGILFSVPEYAGALPGSFKNLLDWTIGDAEPGSIYEKPVGWINASPRGAFGAHAELGAVLGYAHARVIDSACVSLPVTPEMICDDSLVSGLAVDELMAVVSALARGAVPAR
jgi:chromate reductase, NAD(P)H dehydrogenase (quinone)